MTKDQIDVRKYTEMLEQLKDVPDKGEDKLIRVAGIIADYVKKKCGIQLTVVGGLSVEIYTEGGYTTQDIDFVGIGHDQVMEALTELGFARKGKDSIHDKLNVYVEIPGTTLEEADEKYVREVPTQDGLLLTVIGKEDIIKDRLRSYLHWNQLRDREWTYDLIKRHYDDIDMNYINDTLTDDEKDIFNELVDLAKKVNKEASRQEELLFHMDRHAIPYSLTEENVIVLPTKNSFIGFRLDPEIMAYRMDETEEEDTLVELDQHIKLNDLIEWLNTQPVVGKESLIDGINRVYEMTF